MLKVEFQGGPLDAATPDCEAYEADFNKDGWPTVGRCYKFPFDAADLNDRCAYAGVCYKLESDSIVDGVRTLVCVMQARAATAQRAHAAWPPGGP